MAASTTSQSGSIAAAVADTSVNTDVITKLRAKIRQFEKAGNNLNLTSQSHLDIVTKVEDFSRHCDEIQDSIRQLLINWRQESNYPALIKEYCPKSVLDGLQTLFSETYQAIKTYQNVFERQLDANSETARAHALEKCNDLEQRLTDMSLVVEDQPLQMIRVRDEKTSSKSKKSVSVKCKIRCLLPLGRKPDAVVCVRKVQGREIDASVKCVVKPVNTSRSQINTIDLEVKISGFVSSKKSDVNMYTMRIEIRIDSRPFILETLPIIFYKHPYQIPILCGHVLWFNAFTAARVQDPFILPVPGDPPGVTFQELYRVLEAEFHSSVSVMAASMTSLSKSAKPYESQRCFNTYSKNFFMTMFEVKRDSDPILKEALLVKDYIRCNNEKYTTWEWFFACYKAKNENFKSLYERGLIHGFITKDDVADILERFYDRQASFCLLRFSSKYIYNHLGLIQPSLIKFGKGEVKHGYPILQIKFDRNEEKLGKVLIEAMGMKDEDHNLFVLKLDSPPELFQEAFKDFMKDLLTVTDYEDLRQMDRSSRTSDRASPESPQPSFGIPGEVENLIEGADYLLRGATGGSEMTVLEATRGLEIEMTLSQINGNSPLALPGFDTFLNDAPEEAMEIETEDSNFVRFVDDDPSKL